MLLIFLKIEHFYFSGKDFRGPKNGMPTGQSQAQKNNENLP